VLAPAARLVILTYSSHEDRTIKRTFRRLAGRTVHSDMGRSHRKRKPEKLSPGHRDSRTARSSLTFSLALPTDVSDEEPAVPEWAAGFGTQWSMKIVTNTPVQPTPEEIAANPLARSCKLRAAEKVVHDREAGR
jgi:16S rRNA C1402 N4-methylase RsmH